MAELEIKLFGKPEIRREGAEVMLGAALRTLALLILWREREDVEADQMAEALKSLDSDADDHTAFLEKHKKTLKERLGLVLPLGLKPLSLGPAILEQATVDAAEFDVKIGSEQSEEVEEAFRLRERGPLLASLTKWSAFAEERARREEKYLEALWERFQASRDQPQEALRFLKLQIKCDGLAEDRATFLRQERLTLEHELFRSSPASRDGKTTRRGSPLFLPRYSTELLGREAEIAAVQERLSVPGLVTLTGPAGIGKTRLAVAAAARLQEGFSGGAGFADLAATSTAEQIVAQISAVLGLTEEKERSRRETLLLFLSDKTLLLVWDNCEHLAEDCAALAADLLRCCPAVRLLATSREALRVYGERLYPLPALPKDSAVQLFEERAEAASPGFRITEQNRAAVVNICRDLDGLPLALELAAAQLPMRTVSEIAGSLDKRFALLVDGPRGGASRHTSLEAAFDLSYTLLSPAEQALFRTLGVFVGSFSRDAAEAVCAEADTGTLLTRLVRKSLVVAEENSDEMRFRLLASLRQYAEDRLRERGEWEEMRRRHRSFFRQFSKEANPQLHGPNQAQWFARVETEHDNLRAALDCYHKYADGDDEWLLMIAALWWFWWVRGHATEGRSHIALALSHAKDASAEMRSRALEGAGVLATFQGDYKIAAALLAEGYTLMEQLGKKAGMSSALQNLGIVAERQGNYRQAQDYMGRALQLQKELGNKEQIAGLLQDLGTVLENQHEFDKAEENYRKSLAIRREIGDTLGIANSLKGLGQAAFDRGEYDDAQRSFSESFALHVQLGNKRGIASLHLKLGKSAQATRDYEAAGKRFEDS